MTSQYTYRTVDLNGTHYPRELCNYVNRIDGIICCSHYLRSRITRHLPSTLSHKVHVVQNGVVLPSVSMHSRSISGRPTIGFVGRVTPEKGVHLLLDAVASTSKLKDSCDVVIVGNHGFSASDPLTPYEQDLRKTALRTGLSASFLPFQNRTQLPELYNKVDILVVPSVFPEPFGLVVLEANSYGIPVTHSASGGLMEASGGQSLVFDAGNSNHLSRKLNELVFDMDYYVEKSLHSVTWASLSTWDTRCNPLLSIFSK
jgi:glycosyltransferase involved in cell wall biosynthesis